MKKKIKLAINKDKNGKALSIQYSGSHKSSSNGQKNCDESRKQIEKTYNSYAAFDESIMKRKFSI